MAAAKRSRSSELVSYSSKKAKRSRKETFKPSYPDLIVNPRYGSIVGKSVGFPEILKFKHRYATQRLFTTTSGLQQTYVFRANGMYDPDVTFTGHQPMYFDQVGALYQHFYVLSSKVKFTFVPNGTSVQAPYRITCYVDDDSAATGAATPDGAAEQKHAKTKVCGGGVNPTRDVLTLSYDSQKVWGNNVLANSRQRGSPFADPSEQTYFHAAVAPLDGSSVVTVYCIVEIEYTAVWLELKDLDLS